jgi:hypothetical protein
LLAPSSAGWDHAEDARLRLGAMGWLAELDEKGLRQALVLLKKVTVASRSPAGLNPQ